MKPEALRGHLDALLLAVIADGPAHGYAIIEELKRRSAGAVDLAEGTVYPALHRLEKAALVASRWSTDAPRRRRVYELTDRGRRALGAEREQWRSFTAAVESVFHGGGTAWPAG
jgi:DNA-binding PadR family transcriptional regulator